MGERSFEECVPLGRHIDNNVVLRDQGAQIAVFEAMGIPWEVETQDYLARLHLRMNTLHRMLAHPQLTIGVHVVKLREKGIPAGVPMRSWYGGKIDGDYRERVLGTNLSQNRIYVSLAYETDYPLGKLLGRRLAPRERMPREHERRAFRDIIRGVEKSLRDYGVALLGIRRKDRPGRRAVPYSQVGEALFTILYGRQEKVPVTRRMGAAILRDRPIFDKNRTSRVFEVRTPGVTRRARYFGSIFAYTEYPTLTVPGMLNPLLSAPFGFVLSQTFGYRSKAQSLGELHLKMKRMISHGDEGTEEIDEIPATKSGVQRNRFVLGSHHMSLAVYGDTLPDLDSSCAIARDILLNTGAVITQEDWNLDAAFWAQLPGGWHKIYRTGKTNSLNFSALAPLHNYATGSSNPRWGRSVWDFRTTGGTLYRHNFHAGEVGSCYITGRTGEGKSVLLCTLMLGAVERLGSRCVFFDKDRGAEPCIRFIGGSYLELRNGVPSGLAPLKVLSDTPEDRDHMFRLAKACIIGQSNYELTSDEEDALARAVARQLSMPAELRSWAGIRTAMGWSDRKGAGARLEPWCRGGARGWVFDNDKDEADFDAPAVGIGTTDILENGDICGQMLAHLAYRTRKLCDGYRTTLIWDEVHKALKVPAAAAIIEDELRTIRKKEGVPILASQGPSEVRYSAIASIIKSETPTKIAFSNSDGNWDDYEWLGYNEPKFRQITEDMTHGVKRFLIDRDNESGVCEFDLTPIAEHLWILSGRESTVRLLDEIRAELGDNPEDWYEPFITRAPLVVAKEAERKKKEKAQPLQLEAAE